MVTNLVRIEDPRLPKISAYGETPVVELLRAELSPCNHILNVQKRTKKMNSMLPTPLSAFLLRRQDEPMNTHSLIEKSGMTFALLTKYQSERWSQTLVGGRFSSPRFSASEETGRTRGRTSQGQTGTLQPLSKLQKRTKKMN